MSSGTIRDGSFPYSALAYVSYPGGGAGSAVQLNQYVFLTAAHNVANDSAIPRHGAYVRPAYKLSGGWTSDNTQLGGDVFVHPNWLAATGELKRAYDLAVVILPGGHPHPTPTGQYPTPYFVDASLDTGATAARMGCGPLAGADPFQRTDSGVAFSYYWDQTCAGGIEKQVLGYPVRCNGQVNSSHLACKTSPVTIWGGPGTVSGSYRKLYYPAGLTNAPAMSLVNSGVIAGNSGGPVFGRRPRTGQWDILGIVVGEIVSGGTNGIDGTAAIYTQKTQAFIQRYLTYTPPTAFNITSPEENGIYDRGAVPNLVASAGAATSQLQWSSDLDGYLGTGGNVYVAGRLSAGAHTITATLPGTALKALGEVDAGTVVQTLHITVAGSSSPSITVTPSVVQIPATATTGPFTFSWNVPGYSSLDVRAKVNDDTDWGPPTWIAAAGTSGANIPLDTRWTFGFFPHGASSPLLGSFTVSGVAAPPPVFYVTPSSGQVPIGPYATQGPYSFGWNAPGYTSLDIWGQVDNGSWQFGATVDSADSLGNTIAAGVHHRYRFYPHGDSVNILGSLSVVGVTTETPTFTISPSTVVVPANQTTGPFTFTWRARGYVSLDVWGRVNGGPWQFGLNIPPTGNNGANIPVGDTWEYGFFPPGNSVDRIGYLKVTARH
jgi:hypothetical protein